MAQYGKKAQTKVGKVMREMKEGKLKSGNSNKKVTNRKQAIAIGLSEARKAGGKVPAAKASVKKSATAKPIAKKSTAAKSTKKVALKSTAKKTVAAKPAAKKISAAKWLQKQVLLKKQVLQKLQ